MQTLTQVHDKNTYRTFMQTEIGTVTCWFLQDKLWHTILVTNWKHNIMKSTTYIISSNMLAYNSIIMTSIKSTAVLLNFSY